MAPSHPVIGAVTAPIELPVLPAALKDFIPYFTSQQKTPVGDVLKPFVAFESELRKVYAQQPHHEVVQDGLVNAVPIFTGHECELKIRARELSAASEAENDKYIMPLANDQRKPNGSPAIVTSFREFQKNFNLFSETSLSELDWSNVVAAGSSVTTALLSVPEKWARSKRSLREYYHDHLAPASDVDLFLYGLTEHEAIEKIKQIERSVRDSVLQEVTTIRTKNTITIASQYPTRHVQIVLRLYDSISQIITGFDVDCACAAYDGKQVYASPRALASFVTQINVVDLTRRSPSYENRLSKYSHRGFEVYWPLLDRSRIDPTIFERSFHRTQGLARLLVLEKLPKTIDRDGYTDQRRAERGRPPIDRYSRDIHKYVGNIKDEQEDDVAEWVEADEISNYHTLVIPYGKRFTAAKINRILYGKDLLLNAEWNVPKDRAVHLHRHPCFFGTAEDVLGDCCGHCPVASTEEEIEVLVQESKTYISGNLTFVKEDPGRQEIGSFNPTTTDDWTEMAFVGNTQILCQAVVDGDLDYVESWCVQEGNDVNTRDYVGRTPLHLAVTCSSLDIVQCLVDNGSRLVARLVDGRTALHLAAQLGRTDVVKCLMKRSLANEEEESVKERNRKIGENSMRQPADLPPKEEGLADSKEVNPLEHDEESEMSGANSEDWEDSDEESITMGSIVKVKDKTTPQDSSDIPDDNNDEPDVYDIGMVAWDFQTSPLHLAILNGHVNMVKLLVEEYGADALAPIKLFHGNKNAQAALLTLYLALLLPEERSKEVVRVLLELGASTAQADMNHFTALHYIVQEKREDVVDIIFELDRPAAQTALNYVAMETGWRASAKTALLLAIQNGNQSMATKLLSFGANSTISFDDFIKPYIWKNSHAKNWSPEQSMDTYQANTDQPLLQAAMREMLSLMKELLAKGADPNTLLSSSYAVIKNPDSTWQPRASVLDIVRQKQKTLKEYLLENSVDKLEKPEILKSEEFYVSGLVKGSYQHWTALKRFCAIKKENEKAWEEYHKTVQNAKDFQVDKKEKNLACEAVITELGTIEEHLISAGAKTFAELYSGIPEQTTYSRFGSGFIPPEPICYETYFNFQIANLNDALKEGYFLLFEAVWANDIDKVKALTLNSWKGSDGIEHPPLEIATTDAAVAYPMQPHRTQFRGFSPFSLAVLRKHLELAKVIIQIAQAQYQPEDDKSRRPRLGGISQNYSDSEDSEMDGDDEEAPIIHTSTINDTFTFNITDVSDVVKSHVTPLTMIEWECDAGWLLGDKEDDFGTTSLIAYAVRADDTTTLKFLLELCAEQTAFAKSDKNDDATAYEVNRHILTDAIMLGRTAAIAELIKATGVGLPLDNLVKNSGLVIQEKPKYYQGLTVAGKKRNDWAQAGNPNKNMSTNSAVDDRPPLLEAAFEQNIEAIQWFLSDAPARRYAEFAAANKSDKRLEVLERSETGFEKTVINWLSARNELSLHCSILRETDEAKVPEQLAVVKYLLSVMPESLEHKSSQGWSPLQCAVNVSRPDIVKLLIDAGANQRSRDFCGRNVLHNMMVKASSGHSPRTDSANLVAIISQFDKNHVKEMVIEKCTLDSTDTGMTPVAYWLAQVTLLRSMGTRDFQKPDMIQVLAAYSDGSDLEMINGAGDLPLHVAVRKSLCAITSYLISLNPSLLHRENTVGITPLELSSDLYLQERVSNAPPFTHRGQHASADTWTDADKPPSFFRTRTQAEEAEERLMESSKKRTYEICSDAAQEAGPMKRRLVSLWEANEVAKRLAGAAKRLERNGNRDAEEEQDEVTQWMVAV